MILSLLDLIIYLGSKLSSDESPEDPDDYAVLESGSVRGSATFNSIESSALT